MRLPFSLVCLLQSVPELGAISLNAGAFLFEYDFCPLLLIHLQMFLDQGPPD